MSLNTIISTGIVLDLDGVIIRSNFIKYRAMLSLFTHYSDLQAYISEYILAHGGVSRRDKLTEIISNILGQKVDDEILSDYLNRYAQALDHEISIAPLVDGVSEFLARREHLFYVCSSAPESEVHNQLSRRNLLANFSEIFASDTPKTIALKKISELHKGNIVFFGDSIGDLEAAKQAGVAFVAVIAERDNFIDYDIVKLNDFTSFSIVQNCIQQALNGRTL